MKRSLLTYLFFTLLIIAASLQSGFGQTYHNLGSGNFTQDWTTTTMITANDNWGGVASIIGYLGDGDAGSPTAVDPQTVLIPLINIDVVANQTNPNTLTAGGVAEFEIVDPVVALQGSGTADFPNLVIFLNSTGRGDIRVQYDLRDVDGATDNSVQPFALQYRIGSSGNFTNIPAGYVADASTGPSLATLVTHMDVTLPSDCNGQAELQIRILTTNAVGSDEWIGIDNISITSSADATAPIPTFNPANGATEVIITAIPTITFSEPIRKTDGSPLVDADLTSLLTFKKTNDSGEDVAYTGSIDAGKKVITITPSASLTNSQLYYLAVKSVEDINGNETTASSITFTTIAAATPTITLTNPVGGETVYAGDPYTFTWTSANVSNVILEGWVPNSEVPRVYSWQPISGTISAASGSYNFSIPADANYGTQYKIRISDASNAAINSVSGEFTLIATPTDLANLKARCLPGEVVKMKFEVFLTFKASTTNIYAQDAVGGILIYDTGSKMTGYNVNDGVTGLTGTVATFNNILELVPIDNAGAASSTGNTITPVTLTAASLNTDYETYESMLVKIINVTFAAGGGTFATSTSYDITDASGTTIFYTKFSTADYIGTTIPSTMRDVTGLCVPYNTTAEITSRNLDDIDFATGIERNAGFNTELYPVPATDMLQVRNIRNIKAYELLDATGRMIRKSNVSSDGDMNISVSELKHGIYYIRFNTTEGRVIKKFVK